MNVYRVALMSSFRRQMRNRSALLFTVSFYALLIVAWCAIWWAATRAAGGIVHGYDYESIVWYIAGTEAVVVVTSSRRIERMSEEIVGGSIETEMLRPVSVVGLRIATDLGESLATFVPVFATQLLLGVLYTQGVPSFVALALFVPAAVLAIGCNVVARLVFASLSFWVRDAKAAWFLYQKAIFLLGGMILPLQFYPDAFFRPLLALPFWTMAYAPGRLASGFVEPLLLVGQVVWLAILIGIAVRFFVLGERRVQQGVV